LIALGPTCATEEALIDGSAPIPDGQMTASSVNLFVYAHSARINFSGAWCASFGEIGTSPPQMWIQVRRYVLLLKQYNIVCDYIGNPGTTKCSYHVK